MQLPDALSAAIEFEHKVRDQYGRAAKAVEDPQGRRVFETLAKEEQGHVDYLESRLGEWKRSGAVTDAELPTLLPPAAWLKAEAKKLSIRRGDTTPGHTSEISFLKEALENERKATEFYEGLVAALDPRYRALFERFLEIEGGHTLIVQAEIDALAGHGHWFDFMEFSLEK